MLSTLQREFPFRKLLQPHKESKEQYSEGTPSKIQLHPRGFHAGTWETSQAHPRRKVSLCTENVPRDAFLTPLH